MPGTDHLQPAAPPWQGPASLCSGGPHCRKHRARPTARPTRGLMGPFLAQMSSYCPRLQTRTQAQRSQVIYLKLSPCKCQTELGLDPKLLTLKSKGHTSHTPCSFLSLQCRVHTGQSSTSCVYLSGFRLGAVLPSRGHFRLSRLRGGEVLRASRGQRPRMLPDFVQCPGGARSGERRAARSQQRW